MHTLTGTVPAELLERMRSENHPQMVLEEVTEADTLAATIWWPDGQPALGGVCRSFEHVGLELLYQDNLTEHTNPSRGSVHRYTFAVRTPVWPGSGPLLCEAFTAQSRGGFVIDEYASLICAAGLPWRDVVLVRAAARFLRQAGLNFSHPYIAATLRARPEFTRHLTEYFHARFDPDVINRDASTLQCRNRIDADIDAAETLDDDRILRSFTSFVAAVVRTNWYQLTEDGSAKPYAAFKIDSQQLSLTTSVTPYREIFVDANDMEGIHVRSAAVARGGLRFSDRAEDYRTEVLSLMKTQTVKNAPIVPSGAKGAFIRRSAAITPAQAYETFIRGLLDVVDNRTDNGVVTPDRTVAHDGADSYLVVAADKGTAHFSDLANSIACERNYWLADAFASGGATGYDHKAMGITARGAWLSVRRHFEDLGIDVTTDPVSVVGIGDMSGDVFGNGMLLSDRLRLIAAFDHRHIFVDPDPDPAVSFAARRALAAQPGSSWADYDRTALSAGGDIYPRTAKQITLSRQAQQRLGTRTPTMTPDELIRAVLTCEVDLLWNGGIGTYVKASTERHADAADPANDSVRVDATELRCRVVGEGGNLGFTQRARIEYALAGGRINADFIDNSAGVATSDLEVNLKIAVDTARRRGLLTEESRNRALAEATDEVARIVLQQCDNQLLAIDMASSQAPRLVSRHERLIATLEQNSGIDRSANVLPSTEELCHRTRAGLGLARPEIAVLLAHSKNVVREELLDSEVVDHPVFREKLAAYFPARIRRVLGDLDDHPLKREIVATRVTDDLINHLGPGLIYQLEERLGVRSPTVAAAYVVVRDLFEIGREWSAVCAGPTQPVTDRSERLHALQHFVEHTAARLLRRHGERFDIAELLQSYRPYASRLRGRPEWSRLRGDAMDLIDTACRFAVDADTLSEVYLGIDDILGLTELCARFDGLSAAADWWDAMAGLAIRDELTDRRQALVEAVLSHASTPSAVSAWVCACSPDINRFIATANGLHRDGRWGLAQATTLVGELRLLHDQTRRAAGQAR